MKMKYGRPDERLCTILQASLSVQITGFRVTVERLNERKQKTIAAGRAATTTQGLRTGLYYRKRNSRTLLKHYKCPLDSRLRFTLVRYPSRDYATMSQAATARLFVAHPELASGPGAPPKIEAQMGHLLRSRH